MAGRTKRAAPPAKPGGYEVRFLNGKAEDGWEDLARSAPGPLRTAWEILGTSPTKPTNPQRHHPLEAGLGFVEMHGKRLVQWQYEVTGSGRIWFCVDEEKRVVYLTLVSAKHPKQTE